MLTWQSPSQLAVWHLSGFQINNHPTLPPRNNSPNPSAGMATATAATVPAGGRPYRRARPRGGPPRLHRLRFPAAAAAAAASVVVHAAAAASRRRRAAGGGAGVRVQRAHGADGGGPGDVLLVAPALPRAEAGAPRPPRRGRRPGTRARARRRRHPRWPPGNVSYPSATSSVTFLAQKLVSLEFGVQGWVCWLSDDLKSASYFWESWLQFFLYCAKLGYCQYWNKNIAYLTNEC